MAKHKKRYLDPDLAFEPMKLTKAQQKEADEQLAEALKISRAQHSEEWKLMAKLMQLQFKLEEYMNIQYAKPGLPLELQEFKQWVNRAESHKVISLEETKIK
jgi:hypothetical protein